MSASWTCPKCGSVVTGTLAQIQGHRCGSQPKSKKKRDTRPTGLALSALRFTVCGLVTPSGNELVFRSAFDYAKTKKNWCTAIAPAFAGFTAADPDSCWRLEITRLGSKELDKDNLYAGVKPLVDAIRYAGGIPEDSPDAIDLVVRQRKVSRAEIGVVVHLLAVDRRPAG